MSLLIFIVGLIFIFMYLREDKEEETETEKIIKRLKKEVNKG